MQSFCVIRKCNKLSLEILGNIFKVKENKRLVRQQYKLNLETPGWNQATSGPKTLKIHGTKIWNSLPFHVKLSVNLNIVKSLMKNLNDNFCSCTVCTK